MNSVVTRRSFATHIASVLSTLGIAGAVLGNKAQAQASNSQDAGVQKFNFDGTPADGKQIITSLIVHNGLIYISGQGANDGGDVKAPDITSHTTKVMDNVKKLVEQGGGTMESILQLTVYLGSMDYYDPMNKVFKNYFPKGGPARTTVSVAGIPGHSLLEINCIAAVVRK